MRTCSILASTSTGRTIGGHSLRPPPRRGLQRKRIRPGNQRKSRCRLQSSRAQRGRPPLIYYMTLHFPRAATPKPSGRCTSGNASKWCGRRWAGTCGGQQWSDLPSIFLHTPSSYLTPNTPTKPTTFNTFNTSNTSNTQVTKRGLRNPPAASAGAATPCYIIKFFAGSKVTAPRPHKFTHKHTNTQTHKHTQHTHNIHNTHNTHTTHAQHTHNTHTTHTQHTHNTQHTQHIHNTYTTHTQHTHNTHTTHTQHTHNTHTTHTHNTLSL